MTLLFLIAPLLFGCGEQGPGRADGVTRTDALPAEVECEASSVTPQAMPTAIPASCGEVRTAVLVIDAGSGPRLCTGPMFFSSPPQCSGPEIVGWSWDEVASEESGGVRVSRGGVLVTGTLDGQKFTLAGLGTDEDPDLEAWREFSSEGDVEDRFAAECAPPRGGWKVVDPARSDFEHRDAGVQAAQTLEGHVDTRVHYPKGVSPRELGETETRLNLATNADTIWPAGSTSS